MSEAFLMNKSGGVDPDLTLKNVYCVEDVDDIIDCCSLPIIGYNENRWAVEGGFPLSHGWYALAGYDWYYSEAYSGFFNYTGGELKTTSTNFKSYYDSTTAGITHSDYGNHNDVNVYGKDVRIKENDYLVVTGSGNYWSGTKTLYLKRLIYTVTNSTTVPTVTSKSVSVGTGYYARICKLSNNRVIVCYKSNMTTVNYKIYSYNPNTTDAPTLVTSGNYTDPTTNYDCSGYHEMYPLSNDRYLERARVSEVTGTDVDDEGYEYDVYTDYNHYRVVTVSSSNTLTFGSWVKHNWSDSYTLCPIYFEKNGYTVLMHNYKTSNWSVSSTIKIPTLCINSTSTIKINSTQTTGEVNKLQLKYFQIPQQPNTLVGLGSASTNVVLANVSISISSSGVPTVTLIQSIYQNNCDYESTPQFIGRSYYWNGVPNGWYDKYALEDNKPFLLAHGAYYLGYYSDGSSYYYQSGAFTPFIIFNADFLGGYPTGAINVVPQIGKVTGSTGQTVKGKFLLKKITT